MTKTTEDLVREINELRNELRQMREIVNMLFSIVVESEDDDVEEYLDYPMFGGIDQNRLNN
ncbi:MAG: hypothetical protein NO474_06000 [Methanomassiliicoccales archaeon]|jgi:hypothetical protein|nr:hypothetical protein [Methanomassiliicoccales archaeon]MCQ5376131.1 hypothetical protein [Methanomassiliicoccales archaeon]